MDPADNIIGPVVSLLVVMISYMISIFGSLGVFSFALRQMQGTIQVMSLAFQWKEILGIFDLHSSRGEPCMIVEG